ncbi:MAG: histidine kinase [Spirosomaceae bacterium]|nr:histidine kinase [Spirosomataceae bacterium]
MSASHDILQYTPHDRKARLIGVPLVAIIMHFSFHKWHGIDLLFFKELFVDFLFTLVYWEGMRFIWQQLSFRLPSYQYTKKRIVAHLLCSLIYAFLATVLLRAFAQWFLEGNVVKANFWLIYGVALVPSFMVTLVYESAFFFWAWRTNVQKTEALARENVQSQLEALKSQLDPHFLFNSLNTLASLIDDDNVPAQKYLEQLSDVYRYVLVSREKNTVTLEEEMAFLEAYIYLNKTRFRENLQIETQVSAAARQQQIAPLSLQLLVENAIKHNVISRDNPLKIKILQEHNTLTVENNLQTKKTFEKSTKVGLQNIINRYRLLTERPVEVVADDLKFAVKVPLL